MTDILLGTLCALLGVIVYQLNALTVFARGYGKPPVIDPKVLTAREKYVLDNQDDPFVTGPLGDDFKMILAKGKAVNYKPNPANRKPTPLITVSE